jgi:hypothetical protein
MPRLVSKRWTDEFFISEYLRLGSVDRVFAKHKFSLPISPPTYHRLINSWGGVGVVKTAGPNSNLSEILLILSRFLDTKLPLETFFRKHVPASLKPTLSTSHRVVKKVREGMIRRLGTALIITAQNDPYKVLVGQDISLTNTHFGHKGDLSIPMGYSKHKESRQTSIRRILEREVYSKKVIDKTFPYQLIPENPRSLLTISIADVSVRVYHLKLPSRFLKTSNLSSFKLKKLHLTNLEQLTDLKPLSRGVRPGVVEIIRYYKTCLDPSFETTSSEEKVISCQLNQNLAYVFSN